MGIMQTESASAVGPPRLVIVIGMLAAIMGLLALPPSNVATMGLIIAGVLLSALAPPVMISVLLLTVPVQEAMMLPYFRGDLTLTQIAVVGLIGGWGMTFWRHRIWLDAITFWFLMVGAAFLISLVAMDEPGLWVGEVYRWVAAAICFIICRSVLRDWNAIAVVLWGIIAATMSTSFFSIGQAVGRNGPEDLFRGGVLRVYAAFGTPNPLAAYLEFTVPLLAIFALVGLHPSLRGSIGTRLWIASGMTSVIGTGVLVMTQSRGGMVGFAAAMGIALLVVPVRLRLAAVVAGFVVVGAIAVTPAGQSQLGRFEEIIAGEEESRTGSTYDYGTGRTSLWGAAISMFAEKPLTGVGAGEFDYHYRDHTPVWYDRFPRGQAHNGWLQMGAQAGIPGVAAFTGWVVATLVSLCGAARRSMDSRSRALALGALAVMFAFTIHSLVDYLNVLSLSFQLSAVTAIGLNLARDPLTALSQARSSPSPDVIGTLETGTA